MTVIANLLMGSFYLLRSVPAVISFLPALGKMMLWLCFCCSLAVFERFF